MNVLEPAFEPSFIFDSFASRKGKGTHAAIDRLEDFLRRGSRNGSHRIFALKCDISKFFDSIQHDVLMGMLALRSSDELLLQLVDQVVTSHSSDKGISCGLPLGNVTSQLFANIYLNGFDHWVKEHLRVRWYVRFCDDFILLHESRQFLESALLQIDSWLSRYVDELVSQYEETGVLEENFSEMIQSCLAVFDHGQEFGNQKRLRNLVRLMTFKNF